MDASVVEKSFERACSPELKVPALVVAILLASGFCAAWQDIREIGARLKVGLVLEGSVRQTDECFRGK
jgi:TolB-like protein